MRPLNICYPQIAKYDLKGHSVESWPLQGFSIRGGKKPPQTGRPPPIFFPCIKRLIRLTLTLAPLKYFYPQVVTYYLKVASRVKEIRIVGRYIVPIGVSYGMSSFFPDLWGEIIIYYQFVLVMNSCGATDNTCILPICTRYWIMRCC